MSREVLAAIQDLRAEVRQLRIELAMAQRQGRTPREARYERRCARFRELADALGLGATYPAATTIVQILAGVRPAPAGCERTVRQLLDDAECPTGPRAIYRALSQLSSDGDND